MFCDCIVAKYRIIGHMMEISQACIETPIH